MPERSVLALSHSSGLGGAERNLAEMLEALLDERMVDRVDVIVPADGPLAVELRTRGIAVHKAPVAWWIDARPSPLTIATRWWGLARSARAVAAVIRQLQPDVALSSTLASPVLALAARRTRTPHAWLVQEFVGLDHGLAFVYGEHIAMRLVRASSRWVLALSEALARHLQSRGIAVAAIVPPTMRLFHPVLSDQPESPPLRLVIAGSIQPGKGQSEALRATALLRGAGDDARLTIVGPVTDRPYLADIRSEAAHLGAESYVDILPPTASVAEAFAQHHIVLCCSRSEALGRVLIEAQLSGRVVVAADSGAFPELVTDGVTGVLYRCGEPASLAGALERLLDPVLRDVIASAARVHAQRRFTASATAHALANAMSAVLQR